MAKVRDYNQSINSMEELATRGKEELAEMVWKLQRQNSALLEDNDRKRGKLKKRDLKIRDLRHRIMILEIKYD